MMRTSSRALPGGLSAARTRCTRRSLLVTVPSASHQLAEAGSTTSASSAVAVRKMSCTTRWSRLSNRCLTWCASASDWIGFSPSTNIVVSSPRSDRLEHLGHVPAVLRLELHAPGALVLRDRLGVGLEVLEARQAVRDRAHVAAALHVVLAAQRVQAGAVAPDVPGEQREVDQPEHVVDRVVVLGDAERPADLGAVGARVRVRDVLDHVGGHAAQRLGPLERVRLDRRDVGLEARCAALDELAVVQPGVDDLARHPVRQRDVAAHVEAEPRVGPLRGRRAARVDREHPRAVVDRLQHVVEEDRVRLAGVRSPQQDHVRVLHFLI